MHQMVAFRQGLADFIQGRRTGRTGFEDICRDIGQFAQGCPQRLPLFVGDGVQGEAAQILGRSDHCQ